MTKKIKAVIAIYRTSSLSLWQKAIDNILSVMFIIFATLKKIIAIIFW